VEPFTQREALARKRYSPRGLVAKNHLARLSPANLRQSSIRSLVAAIIPKQFDCLDEGLIAAPDRLIPARRTKPQLALDKLHAER
jgi:hypothetical protein